MFGLKTAQNLQRCVQVEWEDGLLAKFSYVWLRDNTRRRPSLVHLDLNTRPDGIKCSREALEVQWPPFMASKYTSNFLRNNALYHPADKHHPSTSGGLTQLASKMSASRYDPLNGNLLSIVDSRFPVDQSRVIGKCYWEDAPQEPGTIWPHLEKVPSVCVVDTLNGQSAELSFVDTMKALAKLRERHPKEFDFLAGCVLEYKEGPFSSTHPIIRLGEGNTLMPGVFNNAARSSAITVESLDELYESLQKFGRICAENTHQIQLQPGQRLLFNNANGMLGVPAQAGRTLMLRCLL